MARSVEEIYELGKNGNFQRIEIEFENNLGLAGKAVRYVQPISGWTLLHQAAYWGDELGIRLCLIFGGSLEVMSIDGQTPIDVAISKGNHHLGEILRMAVMKACWRPVTENSSLRASSCVWGEATPCTAQINMTVGYGGRVISIPKGGNYYSDSWGRVLVGWHGSYDPPYGMDGVPMVKRRTTVRR